jgi:hypothetical protein
MRLIFWQRNGRPMLQLTAGDHALANRLDLIGGEERVENLGPLVRP